MHCHFSFFITFKITLFIYFSSKLFYTPIFFEISSIFLGLKYLSTKIIGDRNLLSYIVKAIFQNYESLECIFRLLCKILSLICWKILFRKIFRVRGLFSSYLSTFPTNISTTSSDSKFWSRQKNQKEKNVYWKNFCNKNIYLKETKLYWKHLKYLTRKAEMCILTSGIKTSLEEANNIVCFFF